MRPRDVLIGSSLLSATGVAEGRFTVYGTRPDGEFFWEVKAIRADIDRLEVERVEEPRGS